MFANENLRSSTFCKFFFSTFWIRCCEQHKILFSAKQLGFTMVHWDSIDRVVTEPRGRAFQTLGQAFEALREYQKHGRVLCFFL